MKGILLFGLGVLVGMVIQIFLTYLFYLYADKVWGDFDEKNY